MSRNKDRLGTGTTKPENNSPPPQALQQDNPGFSFVVPTEFVDLPSNGLYYTEGHPLHGQDCIEIKQMTAKEEDILTSRTLLKKGVALDRVLQSLIIDKSINTDTLLIGDRNAIIIAARRSAYGNIYETSVTCPGCAAVQPYSFDLNEGEVYAGDDYEGFNVTDNKDGTFSVLLPKTQIEVTFRLLTGSDERKMLNNATKKKNDIYENIITTQLNNIVVAVNGDNSSQAIRYLVENIPSMDSRHLRATNKLVTPNIDLTQNFACNECDYEVDMEVPLSADFFWPQS